MKNAASQAIKGQFEADAEGLDSKTLNAGSLIQIENIAGSGKRIEKEYS